MRLIAFVFVLFILLYDKLPLHGSMEHAAVAAPKVEEVFSGLFQVAPAASPKERQAKRPPTTPSGDRVSSIRSNDRSFSQRVTDKLVNMSTDQLNR
jgi:hypothetical protein